MGTRALRKATPPESDLSREGPESELSGEAPRRPAPDANTRSADVPCAGPAPLSAGFAAAEVGNTLRLISDSHRSPMPR
jgi:hypothetical protein